MKEKKKDILETKRKWPLKLKFNKPQRKNRKQELGNQQMEENCHNASQRDKYMENMRKKLKDKEGK